MNLLKLRLMLQTLENRLFSGIDIFIKPGGFWPPFQPALACNVTQQLHPTEIKQPIDPKAILDSLFDGILNSAVPKKRRSWERRHMRRHGPNKLEKFATPKRGIVSCFNCGKWHEANTLCGHCYEKVKEETEKLKATIDNHTFYYDTPHEEIKFVYADERARAGERLSSDREGEIPGIDAGDATTGVVKEQRVKSKDMYGGKYVVEVDHEKPSWWSRNLLTKSNY